MPIRVLVTLDGTVHDPDRPFLLADDLAAVRGDGVFETVLLRDGRPRWLGAHLDRLVRSAAMLDLPEPDRGVWIAAVEVAAAEWGAADEGLMRLLLSRGREGGGTVPTAYVTVGPVAERVARVRAEGIAVITLERGVTTSASDLPWALLGAKTLSYATNMAALRHAESLGADDVIYLSPDGSVLEGPRSTVVAATGRTLVSPPNEIGILPGTTVDAVFEEAADAGYTCRRDRLTVSDLVAAEGLWLLSSITLAARVRALDGVVRRASTGDGDFRTFVERAVASR